MPAKKPSPRTTRAKDPEDIIVPLRTISVNTKNIGKGIEDLQQFSMMFADPNIPESRTSSSGGASSGVSLSRIIEGAMREVLGRVPSTRDPRSFVTALNQSFDIRQVEGHTEFSWNPRSYAGQTDLGGGVTGYQASIYARGRDMLDKALPLLDGLYSLKANADKEESEAHRSVIRSSLQELVHELGLEGGPRSLRIDDLFTASLTSLESLQSIFGLENGEDVNTLEEETNYSSSVALEDYITSFQTSWTSYKVRTSTDLGTGLVRLSRALSVAAESVGEVRWALGSVLIGEAERRVIRLNGQEMTVDDYLDWVSHFTTQEAPNLIHDSGKIGIKMIPNRINKLKELLVDNLKRTTTPRGMTHPRVQKTINELESYFDEISNIANNI
jgi:hypothetical protein